MIDEAYDFNGITNVALPTDVYAQDVINYTNLTSSNLGTSFVAVKVGDVDDDAVPNSFMAGETRGGNRALTFHTQEQSFKAGEIVRVAFTADNFDQMTAYQFTYGFDQDALEYVGKTAGALNVSGGNFGDRYTDRGMLTTVWYASEAMDVASDEVLFTITFRAKASGTLSGSMSVGSAVTEALAFSEEAGRTDVALEFNTPSGETLGDAFALFQNTPNPFKGETSIGFILPEDGDAQLNLFDVSGRDLGVIQIDGRRGYNEIALDRKVIPSANRIVYYQLKANGYLATKKMILIE